PFSKAIQMGSGLVSQTIIKKIFVSVVMEVPRQVGAGEQHEILHSTHCGSSQTRLKPLTFSSFAHKNDALPFAGQALYLSPVEYGTGGCGRFLCNHQDSFNKGEL
ncbi:MAG TPA: hypothetical protein VKA97_01610, partial [Pyrinomonadaceae bacterium]|nr:hypothetical protein [Pyrinomonadaceae bacterium]